MDNHILDLTPEIIVDLFAGGGGASTGIEKALGFPPHVAVNHNPVALSMHRMNHPFTRHHIADVFEVDPRAVVHFMGNRPIAALHASPDCTHHSQAASGQPRNKKIRALPWVVVRWAGQVRPRMITLENVKQILKWGPLIAKRCQKTGRVIKKDGKTVAVPGERVPVQDQFLIPNPKKLGQTWRHFTATLERIGYKVETQIRVAADRGVPTTRERLYMVGRCDGQPIVWNPPSHAKNPGKGQKPWRTAAECMDWGIPCPSIFTRKKPLAPATLRRIARGIKKYVLDSASPFIVPIAHFNGSTPVQSIDEPLRTITAHPKGGTFAMVAPTIVPATHQGGDRVHGIDEPLRTITAAHRGELMMSAPVMVQAAHGDGKPGRAQRWGPGCKAIDAPLGTITGSGGHAIAAAALVQTGYSERNGQLPRSLDIEQPLGTVVGTGKHALASAYLMQANGGFNITPGHDVRDPMSTITNTGSQQQVVAAELCAAHEPIPMAEDGLSDHETIAAFMSSYYTDDSDRCRSMGSPVPTVTTANRVGVVAAHLAHLRGNCDARDLRDPLQTISANGQHHALVEYTLSPEVEAGALRVAAFLLEYYSEGGQWSDLRGPVNTITTRDRLALVTVVIKGTPYVVVDIGLRMLSAAELYLAQGFPDDYVIDRGHDGRRFTKDEQVRMVGNSVPPQEIEDIYRANLGELALGRAAA